MVLSGDLFGLTTMAALAQTLAELDALTTLSEALKERIDAQVAKARVALERMAVAMEDNEAGEFTEPKELEELKMLEAFDSNELQRLRIVKDNEVLYLASKKGHAAVVERLLQDERVDPSANNNEAIQWASLNGHVAVVDRLLQDERVDPSARNNNAIRLASYNGRDAVVERLLQDERVNPATNNNYAIRMASRYGHLAVVNRLLQDERVDPSAKDNEAIRWASANGHVAVVELLKAHGCVLPQEPPQEPHP